LIAQTLVEPGIVVAADVIGDADDKSDYAYLIDRDSLAGANLPYR
jgi:hypothetical protein